MECVNVFEKKLAFDLATKLWQDPHDDSQFTIIPARLTGLNGSLGIVNSRVGSYRLPTPTGRYVVYISGQSSPLIIGIMNNIADWTSLDTLVKSNEMVVHAHIKQRMLPLSGVYVCKTSDNNNVLYAVNVAVCGTLLNLNEPLHLHFYSNNWLAESGSAIEDPVLDYSTKVTRLQLAADILTKYNLPADGDKILYHNGYYVNTITTSEIAIGDTLSLSIDKTGRGYFDLAINDLKHFTSIVDERGKVIVQVPDEYSESPLSVEPCDEVEIYICNQISNPGGLHRVRGIYYSRIRSSDIRMLTHRDYSLDAVRIDALLEEHADALDGCRDPFLRIFLRNTTDQTNVTMDSIFLHDLFRVTASDRLYLMSDAAGTYEAWKAENLEASPMNLIHVKSSNYINFDNITNVYSLPELNKRLRTGSFNGSDYMLPEVMTLGGKVLCFDAVGKLVNILDVEANSQHTYISLPVNVVSVECIPGVFTKDGSDFDRDTDFVDIASYFDEKYYSRSMQDADWVEAIEGNDYHIDVNTGKIVWDAKHNADERMKRSLKDAIYIHHVVEPEMIYHPIDLYPDGKPPTLLRLARLDVYVNGRRGIENLDYIVDYPMVYICNKEYYLSTDDDIVIDIFHHGVPGNPTVVPYSGFIKFGLLRDSDPDVFFEHRNMSMTVDGYRAELADLGIYECPSRVSSPMYREGAPYSAEAWPWCLGPWGRKRLFNGNYAADTDASGTVGKLLQRPKPDGALYITHGHSVFSYFLKRMLVKLRADELDVSRLGLSDVTIAMALRPYLEDLSKDVTQLGIDPGMIDVHPTPNIQQVDITEYELLFLRKISKTLMGNRVIFNTYANIQEDIAPHD